MKYLQRNILVAMLVCAVVVVILIILKESSETTLKDIATSTDRSTIVEGENVLREHNSIQQDEQRVAPIDGDSKSTSAIDSTSNRVKNPDSVNVPKTKEPSSIVDNEINALLKDMDSIFSSMPVEDETLDL